MKQGWSQGAWVRWGWLAITLALGAGLIVLSWANDRSARQATQALYWGQSRLITDGAFRDLFHNPETLPAEADLARVLADRASEGLRYVALFDQAGRILRSAGKPSSDSATIALPANDEHGPVLTQVGSRVRLIFFRRLPAPDSLSAAVASTSPAMSSPAVSPPAVSSPAKSAPASTSPASSIRPASGRSLAAARGNPGPPPSRPGVLLEFEPLIATRLVQRSTRLLVSGIAAAALMMVAASVFWRLSRRYEQAQRHLEKERRLSLLGEMSAVLAHEIRNPLASLKGHAQLLSEHLPSETPDRRKADLVVSEATRLEVLTADLLDFARTGPLDLGTVNPSELVRACAAEVAPGGFALDLDAAPGHWRCDEKRIRGALTNILRNAREASPAGSRPEVRLATWQRQLLITVRDHGAGLPAGQEDRIFDPFFTTRASGTGLGLSVARRVVELHGGSLTAANHETGGAVFEIALPNGKD